MADKDTQSKEIWVKKFDDESGSEFAESLIERFEEAPDRPIIINIDSYGGSVDALIVMLDAIDSIRTMSPKNRISIITHATGKAMSAGAILLAHGDVRLASPNTRIMLHQISGGMWGSAQDMKIEHEEMMRLNKRLLTILADNCKIKGGAEELEKTLQRDLYLTPTQAKEFGLIDIVGSPRLIEVVNYELAVLNGGDNKNEKPKGKNKLPSKERS